MKNLAVKEEIKQTLKTLIKCYAGEEKILLRLKRKYDNAITNEETVGYFDGLQKITEEIIEHNAEPNALKILALIQEVRARKREEKGIHYDPIIYKGGEELRQLFISLANLAYEPDATLQLDIIACLGTHYTPFSLRVKNCKLVVGYIDGSTDTSNLRFIRALLSSLLPPTKVQIHGYIASDFSPTSNTA